MFNKDFFPTPLQVIEAMTQGETIKGRVFLEPSAGKGNIVDYLLNEGAKDVVACENNDDLQKILSTKCKVIESDFLNLTSDRISHVDCIIMNPPFSADDRHILHAYNIAPAGCTIIALCNAATLQNDYTKSRQELKAIVQNFGSWVNLENCFTEAERQTEVYVGLIKLQKPGEKYSNEFEGFLMEEEPEDAGQHGIMSYNVVRDLVNRYVGSVKIFDEQLLSAVKLNNLLRGFYGSTLGFQCTEQGKVKQREEFKKDMQRAGWNFIFNKMNLTKYITSGVKDDINKFVEQQTQIPFTMKNIYHMLDIVRQTAGQRMDKAILEAFDNITMHHADNRHHVKGWKTNSHYLVGKKFILPSCVSPAKEYGYTSSDYNYLSSYKQNVIADLEKALCFSNGINYDDILTVNHSIKRNIYGKYYNSQFFKYKAFKNGNMHFEFISEDVWAKFNQRISKIKGYPLFEGKEQTAYQNRNAGRKPTPQKQTTPIKPPVILTTIKLKKAI